MSSTEPKTETTHTPGPWKMGRTDLASYTTNDNTGECERVMYVYRDQGQDRIAIFGDNVVEDARLIAAAPELLAALEAIVAYDCRLGAGLLPQARAAIAKARGV